MQEHLHSWTEIPSRGECWLWTWWLLLPFIVGNLLTATAYLRIPWQLFRVAHGRKGKWLNRETALAAAFILMCGGGHALSVFLVWWNLYPVAVAWDFLTGVVSWVFSFALGNKLRDIIDAPDIQETLELRDFWERRQADLAAHPLHTRKTDGEVEQRIVQTLGVIDRALAAAAVTR